VVKGPASVLYGQSGPGGIEERRLEAADVELLEPGGAGAAALLGGDARAVAQGPGYVASRSVVATKTDTPILETAQSISVIGRKQIEDRRPSRKSGAWKPRM
jgi:iron complex outermembrane receptor protein